MQQTSKETTEKYTDGLPQSQLGEEKEHRTKGNQASVFSLEKHTKVLTLTYNCLR